MALQSSSPHLGDIGGNKEGSEPDPDRIYEQEIESENEEEE